MTGILGRHCRTLLGETAKRAVMYEATCAGQTTSPAVRPRDMLRDMDMAERLGEALDGAPRKMRRDMSKAERELVLLARDITSGRVHRPRSWSL